MSTRRSSTKRPPARRPAADSSARMKCDITGVEAPCRLTAGGERALPRRWRRWNGQVWSAQAWEDHFRPRMLSATVASPVNGTWDELADDVDHCSRRVADVANWHVSQMFARESQMIERGTPLPALPARWDEYQHARAVATDIPSDMVCEAMRRATAAYRARRGQLLAMRRVSLPSFRSGVVPLKAATCSLGLVVSGTAQQVALTCRLQSRRWVLLLSARRGARRVLDTLARVARGELDHGVAQLAWMWSGGGPVQGRTAPGGGSQRRRKLIARVLVYVERSAPRVQSADVLAVSTQPDGLLAATLGSRPEKIWFFNAPHLPRRVAAHMERLQRMSEDRKSERRMPRRRARQMNDHGSACTRRFHAFIDTLVKQCARLLVNYAVRRRVCRIILDTSCRTYCQSFPYFKLETRIKQLCCEERIAFETGVGAPTSDGNEGDDE